MKRIFILLVLSIHLQNLSSQEIILSISGEFNEKKIPLDSLLIENLTNGTDTIFKPVDILDRFQINLTKGSLINNIDSEILHKSEKASILKNVPGEIVINYISKEFNSIYIEITNIEGKKIVKKKDVVNPGNNLFNIKLQIPGIFLVHFYSLNYTKSFKCLGISGLNNSNIILVENSGYYNKSSLIQINSGFQFSSGDNICLTGFKKGLASNLFTKSIIESEDIVCVFVNNEEIGLFIDARDETFYRWIKIGEQTWMAENLAYKQDSSCWVLFNDEKNAKFYGRLYNWSIAMESCPSGWHLPTNEEWDNLASFISIEMGPYSKGENSWPGVGKHLKSKYGWNNKNGTDDFGFCGLPAGFCYVINNNVFFNNQGILIGRWWTSTEYNDGSSYGWALDESNNFINGYTGKTLGTSIRCLKD
ncbi:MAG: hypothetical protein JXR31_12075 [Prolixibacteraceae bacterium]|nr:hypothetical protein [Prolixibacteraceae bacterium]MBN2774983.1 hypothetical protein [Prolixibacteraceae bacterium]